MKAGLILILVSWSTFCLANGGGYSSGVNIQGNPTGFVIVHILDFAYRLGFKDLYDWQCRVLLRYEAGEPVAAACANYTGKTSVIFPVCPLWTLYNFPTARLMYMSATFDQVTNQFFVGLKRFSDHRYFAGWVWVEAEVRTPAGGFLFGRASDVGGNIEGIHDQAGSAAGLLIDEAKGGIVNLKNFTIDLYNFLISNDL